MQKLRAGNLPYDEALVSKFHKAGAIPMDLPAVGEDPLEKWGIKMPNPVMGAEDFAYVLQRVPGAMMFLGGTHPDRDLATAAPNHSNLVNFDEDAMITGAAMHTLMACRHLGTEV